MNATTVLLHLLGEIALLLWGIHMVNSGMVRAFGSDLRWVLSRGLKARLRAFFAGLGVTALLQSSTATAMMITAFSAGGVIELVPALAVMLGANVGTTLIVQLLSFDITLVFPVLLFAGLVAFRQGRSRRLRDLGRVSIGLGLMLLSLHLLTGTITPIESSSVLKSVLTALDDDLLFLALIAAVLAWAAHSSVAAMLCIMSLAAAQVIGPMAALAMVLGANIGTTLNPVLEGTTGDPVKLRVPVGNFVMRLIGIAVAVAFLGLILDALAHLESHPARLAANFHTLFNLGVALLFLPLLPLVARILRLVLPAEIRANDPGQPLYLDHGALETPAVALANAEREVLRMVDIVDTMLRGSQELIREDDPQKVTTIRQMDNVLDRLHGAVHRYLGAIDDEALHANDARRLSELASFAINLEHVGDIIDSNLMVLARKRIRNRLRLSEDALAAIDEMHGRLVDHLQLAAAVLMSHDVASARRLVREKEHFRELERAAAARHLACIREKQDTAASALQLDFVRDLKRVEAHIAATAHAVLEETGELNASRLVGKGR